MNRTNIIGIIVLLAVLIGYSIWMSPSKEEREAYKRRVDSVLLAKQADSVAQAILQQQQKATADSLAAIGNSGNNAEEGVVSEKNISGFVLSQDTSTFYTLENELLRVKISAQGGKVYSVELKEYQTFDSLPLILLDGKTNIFGFDLSTADLRTINTEDLLFKPSTEATDVIALSGKDSTTFAVRHYVSSDSVQSAGESYIEFVYTLRANDYLLGYKVNLVNMEKYLAKNVRDLPLSWSATLMQQEKNLKNERQQSSVYYMNTANEVEDLKANKNDKVRPTGGVKWVSFKQQFFSATLITDKSFVGTEMEVNLSDEKNPREVKKMLTHLSLPIENANNQTFDMNWYFGPNKYKVLRQYKINLERQIPLGWSFFLMQWINRGPVLWIFNWLESFSLNYGIIILILTIFIKILLFPIAFKTYLSQAKQRVLRPEVEEINKKFPKQEDAMKKQQATMALYKKAGVNPMSGCIPTLLQFPILIALFRFFPSAFELRQQSFLWAHDLSSYDSVLNLPFNIPFYGDHVSLFTLLMTISTIIYTKINNNMMGSTNQMPGMKMMMYFMPVMFLGIFNNYSSGLSYYYLLTNLISFAQFYLFRRFVNEDKLHAQIQENKKKPVKKSNFQKRLEELSKQQKNANYKKR